VSVIPVRARYAPDFRQDLDSLKRVLIPTPTGAQIPISLVADIRYRTGPPSIRDENGQLVGFILIDPATSNIDGYVRHAAKRIAEARQISGPGITSNGLASFSTSNKPNNV